MVANMKNTFDSLILSYNDKNGTLVLTDHNACIVNVKRGLDKRCSECKMLETIATTAPKTTAPKTTAPKTTAPKTTAPVDTVTVVKAGVVSSKTFVHNVGGFTLTLSTGTLDAATFKALVSRATTNEWYPVVEYMALQVPSYLTITRSEDGIKSPVSKIDSAINRGRKQGVKNVHKLSARSDASQKGVWYIVKSA